MPPEGGGGRRYATAADLAEDLRRFVAGEAVRARRAGSAEMIWLWCRRNPGVAGLLGTLAVFIATSFVVVFVLWRQSEGLRIESDSRPDLRRIAVLRVDGYTAEEITAELGGSIRAVFNKLKLIRMRWEREGAAL